MVTWFIQSIGSFALLAAVCAALYVMPGMALVHYVWPLSAYPLSSAERFALAIGVSLALPPILIYLCRLSNLKWSAGATWGYALVALVACAGPVVLSGVNRLRSRTRPAAGQLVRPAPWHTRLLTPQALDVGLVIALTLVALVIRLYAVRGLIAGMFGDSVHHTMIVQLLLDNGGLFDSWEPYAPLASMTYHFGFHANTAFYAWLTGTPATLSVLIIGQVLNAAASPLAYLLTTRLVRSGPGRHSPSAFPVAPVAGVLAACLTAFVSLLPFYYTNWGRYTQLAGQLLLVAALVTWIEVIEQAGEVGTAGNGRLRPVWPLVALSAILTLALMLTHYIVTVWAALMVSVYIVISLARRASLRTGLTMLMPAATGAGLALIIALPWIRNTFSSRLGQNAAELGSGALDAARIAALTTLGPVTPFYVRGWMLILAGLGVIFALAQRRWRITLLALWVLVILLTITPQTLGLPGAGNIDQFTGYIALYVFILPAAGYAVAAFVEWVVLRVGQIRPTLRLSRSAITLGSAAVTVLIGAWSATWQPSIIEPSQQMLTAADAHAMTWIRENIPPDARFVVNMFPAYAGTLVAGSDGGWWISLLTRRATTLPPITYGTERFERDSFYVSTNTLAQNLRGRALTDGTPLAITLTTPQNIARLRDAGVTHVYIGANATPGPDKADHIDVTALRQSSAFRLIYDHDGVLIFQLV